MNDSFALLINSIVAESTDGIGDAEFRKKKTIEKLMLHSKNFMNLSNRKVGREVKLEDQHIVNQNLDGMFELVQKYCPVELDDYCSIIFFCNMQDLAKTYKRQITDIAVRRILKLLAEEKVADIQVRVQTDILAENERYKELKTILSKINIDKELKAIVSSLMADIEKPLKRAQEKHRSIILQINNALTGGFFCAENEDEYSSNVKLFLDNDFKKYTEPESTM